MICGGIDNAFVEGKDGKVPLNSVGKVMQTWQPVKIEQRDQNRTIEVSAEVLDGVFGNDVVQRVWHSDRMKVLKETLRVGYKIEIGGVLEESQDASVQMLASFGISFLAIMLILVISYNGWSRTFVILATLPLAVVGAWFGLWFSDNPLGFMPQLGECCLCSESCSTRVSFLLNSPTSWLPKNVTN